MNRYPIPGSWTVAKTLLISKGTRCHDLQHSCRCGGTNHESVRWPGPSQVQTYCRLVSDWAPVILSQKRERKGKQKKIHCRSERRPGKIQKLSWALASCQTGKHFNGSIEVGFLKASWYHLSIKMSTWQAVDMRCSDLLFDGPTATNNG